MFPYGRGILLYHGSPFSLFCEKSSGSWPNSEESLDFYNPYPQHCWMFGMRMCVVNLWFRWFQDWEAFSATRAILWCWPSRIRSRQPSQVGTCLLPIFVQVPTSRRIVEKDRYPTFCLSSLASIVKTKSLHKFFSNEALGKDPDLAPHEDPYVTLVITSENPVPPNARF